MPTRKVAACLMVIAMAAPAAPAWAEGDAGWWRSAKSIRQRDADAALHEMLKISVAGAAHSLSSAEAFAPGQARRIRLPDGLEAIRGDWNAVGRSGALTRLEDAMNRAAFATAASAETAFQEEAAKVNFYDAAAMVMSGSQAASRFFALRARPSLEQRLKAVVEQALFGAGAFAALDEAAAAAGQPGKAGSYRDAVVQRTLTGLLDAMFAETGRIESEVRADPAGRGSPILEQVFTKGPQTARAGG